MRALMLLFTLLLGTSASLQAAEFTVSGGFLYEDKAWYDGGWTGEDPMLPVRFADVTVFDMAQGRVLGRGATDAEGRYTILASSKKAAIGQLAVRVRASTRTLAKANKPFPRLIVQTPEKVIYAAWSDEVLDHPTDADIDLGTTSILKVKVGGDEGNPFNVLDMGVAAFELITDPALGVKRRGPTLRLVWPNPLGSYALGRRASVSPGDGYDDSVILHEVGHLVHNVYSDSDNPGGFHFFGDSNQDPRLSFGEGWATTFAGLVLQRLGQLAYYLDAKGSAQVGGAQLWLDLETTQPFTGLAFGASDEVAVACVLFDMLDGDAIGTAEGMLDDDVLQPTVMVADATPWQAWWTVFTGHVKRSPSSTLNAVWDGWVRDIGVGEELDLVDAIFAERAIRFVNDAYEPNGKRAEAAPISLSARGEWISDLTLYYREAGSTKSGARDRDWFAVELQAGTVVDFETRYPEGAFDANSQADTWMSLHRPSGKRVKKIENGGTGRNASLKNVFIDESGVWTVQVRTRNKVHRYGRYELRVQQD